MHHFSLLTAPPPRNVPLLSFYSSNKSSRYSIKNIPLRRPLLSWILLVSTLIFLGTAFSILSTFTALITFTLSGIALYFIHFLPEKGAPEIRYAGMFLFTNVQMAVLVCLYFFPSPAFIATLILAIALSAFMVTLFLPSPWLQSVHNKTIFLLSVILPLVVLHAVLAETPDLLPHIVTVLAVSTPLAIGIKLVLFVCCTFLSVLPMLRYTRTTSKKTDTYIYMQTKPFPCTSTDTFVLRAVAEAQGKRKKANATKNKDLKHANADSM